MIALNRKPTPTMPAATIARNMPISRGLSTLRRMTTSGSDSATYPTGQYSSYQQHQQQPSASYVPVSVPYGDSGNPSSAYPGLRSSEAYAPQSPEYSQPHDAASSVNTHDFSPNVEEEAEDEAAQQ